MKKQRWRKTKQKMFTQKEVDYFHDRLTDLLISCMKSGCIPLDTEPQVGDWVIEVSSFRLDHDKCIGQLLRVLGHDTYEIELVGGKIVTWRNAEFAKIPGEYLRDTPYPWKERNGKCERV